MPSHITLQAGEDVERVPVPAHWAGLPGMTPNVADVFRLYQESDLGIIDAPSGSSNLFILRTTPAYELNVRVRSIGKGGAKGKGNGYRPY